MSLVLGVGQESQRLWRFLIGAWHVPTLSAASPAVTHPAVSKIPTFYCSVSCGKSSTATLPHKKPHIICKGKAAPPHCCIKPSPSGVVKRVGWVGLKLKVLLEEVVERAPVRVVEAFFFVLCARDALRICRCSARPCVDHEGSENGDVFEFQSACVNPSSLIRL